MCSLNEDADALIIAEADQLKVQRNYDPKPIPTRSFDWCAYIDPERACGYGKTEVDAINDLFSIMDD